MAKALLYLTISTIIVFLFMFLSAITKYIIVPVGYWFYDRWPKCTVIGWIIVAILALTWYIYFLDSIPVDALRMWIVKIGAWYYGQLIDIFGE